MQINAAAEVIYESVDPNANIIFGALVDDSMSGEIAITVIATGFPVYEDNPQQQLPPAEEPITTGNNDNNKNNKIEYVVVVFCYDNI